MRRLCGVCRRKDRPPGFGADERRASWAQKRESPILCRLKPLEALATLRAVNRERGGGAQPGPSTPTSQSLPDPRYRRRLPLKPRGPAEPAVAERAVAERAVAERAVPD
jgi:hypothetical protein